MAAKKKGSNNWASKKKTALPEDEYPFEVVNKEVTLSDGRVIKAKVKVFNTIDTEPGANPVGIKNWYY